MFLFIIKKVMKKKEQIISDEEVRKILTARLNTLSRDTFISIGSEGSFSRDELIEHVEKNDSIGNKIAEIEMEWLRSFKGVIA